MAKKEKNDKNYGAAKAFEEKKQEGRPKQTWVWDVEPADGKPGKGHWSGK